MISKYKYQTMFTPGPWLRKHDFNVLSGMRLVANTGGHCDNRIADGGNWENVANAILISAAPDLFDAILKSDDAHWSPAMRAALRKATGE